MKDQSLRKLQQEMDSLTFRNQQLAKRVELLQDELSLSETRGKKNKVRAHLFGYPSKCAISALKADAEGVTQLINDMVIFLSFP